MESSFLSFLFSTTNFTTKLLIPMVDADLKIEVKFLKLPRKAIPEVPIKTEIILVEAIPKKKLTITEIEFSESIFSNLFSLKIFNFINF